jgi:DNA-binding protein HU-beta
LNGILLKLEETCRGDVELNKMELVNAVADRAEVTRAVATSAIDATFDVISEAMYLGDEVNVKGFGAFSTIERAARTGRNPRTGEAMAIPATRVPQWRAHKSFKQYLNQEQEEAEAAASG